jgi:hypothetical protein
MRDEAKVAGCRLQIAGCRLRVALNVGEVERPRPVRSPPWIWRRPSNVAGGRIHACSEDVPTPKGPGARREE